MATDEADDPGTPTAPEGKGAQITLVLFGPGGVGKGTIAERLVAEVDDLWLSRSWTTRERRPGESETAYHFVTMAEFVAHRDEGGFLEWAESTPENLYGTPLPDAPPGVDILLEIDAQGAQQVAEGDPEALLWFVDAPSDDALRARMQVRGDRADRIDQRMEQAVRERAMANDMGAVRFVNDDLDATVDLLKRRLAVAREFRRSR